MYFITNDIKCQNNVLLNYAKKQEMINSSKFIWSFLTKRKKRKGIELKCLLLLGDKVLDEGLNLLLLLEEEEPRSMIPATRSPVTGGEGGYCWFADRG